MKSLPSFPFGPHANAAMCLYRIRRRTSGGSDSTEAAKENQANLAR